MSVIGCSLLGQPNVGLKGIGCALIGERFIPSDIANLVAWYDARIGGSVGAAPTRNWTNQAAAETATGVGTIDYIDVRDSLLFEGVSADRYTLPSVPAALPMTVIAGVTPQPQVTGNGAVFCISDSGDANRYHMMHVNASGDWEVLTRRTGDTEVAGTIKASAGTFQIVAAEWSATNARRVRVNAGSWESNSVGVDPTDAGGLDQGFLGIGIERTTVITDSPFLGEIHWVLIFDAVLSESEHASIRSWGTRNSQYDIDRDADGFANRNASGEVELVLRP